MLVDMNGFVGKSIKDICGKYDNESNENNCAHFVGHMLSYRLPHAALCSNCEGTQYSYADRLQGFCIRVDQIYNSLTNRCSWPDDVPTSPCIVVATLDYNITDIELYTIGTNPRKHIGIFVGQNVYTHKQVAMTPLSQFKLHFGAETTLLKADLP